MQLIKHVVGVDVSMDSLEVASGTIDIAQEKQVVALGGHHNTPKGFSRLEQSIKREHERLLKLHDDTAGSIPLWIVMEASGVYYERLAVYLRERGYQIAVVLPNKIKAHTRSDNQKSKTDRLDAQAITRYGLEKQLTPWEPAAAVFEDLKALTREYETMQAQLTDVKSREHAHKAAASRPKQLLKRLRQQRELLKKQIKEIEAEIRKLIESDPDTKRRAECAASAMGVGMLTVATIAAETGGFHLVSKPDQLTSFCGLDPELRQSGTSEGKVAISHRGNRHIRRILYMPALSAARHNPQLKQLYLRVFERTRVKKKALVAVMRKLLLLIYALWTKVERYDPQRFLAVAAVSKKAA